MADVRHHDRIQPHQVQVHPQSRFEHHHPVGAGKNYQSGPSMSQVLAVLTLLPVGGTLLALAGLTLTGTVIGLTVATPLFLIFSPILVPATIAVALAVAGFLFSGAFGLTGLSSLTYVFNRLRRATGTEYLDLDTAKRHMQDMTGYIGQKTKEVGQKIESKAHEGTGPTGTTRTTA